MEQVSGEKMLRIRSVGFNTSEIRLLSKQLEILNARMEFQWHYDGEGADGELVLSKKVVEVPEPATLVVVDTKNHKGHHCIQLPIRLKQLAEVLTQDSRKRCSNALRIKKLVTDHERDSVYVNSTLGPVFIDTKKKVVMDNSRTLDELLNKLAGMKNPTTIKKTPADNSLSKSYPYPAVLWQLAKREKEYANHHWKSTKNYKITSWPNIQWSLEDNLTKCIALMFSRSYLSINDVAKATNSDVIQVRNFLHCCDVAGIKITSSDEKNTKKQRKHNTLNARNGDKLLSWLKNKIWSTTNHAD